MQPNQFTCGGQFDWRWPAYWILHVLPVFTVVWVRCLGVGYCSQFQLPCWLARVGVWGRGGGGQCLLTWTTIGFLAVTALGWRQLDMWSRSGKLGSRPHIHLYNDDWPPLFPFFNTFLCLVLWSNIGLRQFPSASTLQIPIPGLGGNVHVTTFCPPECGFVVPDVAVP